MSADEGARPDSPPLMEAVGIAVLPSLWWFEHEGRWMARHESLRFTVWRDWRNRNGLTFSLNGWRIGRGWSAADPAKLRKELLAYAQGYVKRWRHPRRLRVDADCLRTRDDMVTLIELLKPPVAVPCGNRDVDP